MAKAHVTQKWVNQNFQRRLYTGYCNLENLLWYKSPAYYTTRREGWGADIYLIDPQTVIITGYAPFGNIHIPYERAKHYDQLAQIHRDCPELLDGYMRQLVRETLEGVK